MQLRAISSRVSSVPHGTSEEGGTKGGNRGARDDEVRGECKLRAAGEGLSKSVDYFGETAGIQSRRCGAQQDGHTCSRGLWSDEARTGERLTSSTLWKTPDKQIDLTVFDKMIWTPATATTTPPS